MSTKKRANKLKLTEVSSVDLCPQGANPDADICLFKSAEGTQQPPVNTEPATSNEETKRSFFKNLVDALSTAFFSTPQTLPAADVVKDAQSFSDITARQEVDENMWRYLRAFEESVSSIVRDGDIEAAEKSTKLNETLAQFNAKMTSIFPALVGTTKADDNNPGEIDKSIKEGDDTMDINFKDLDTSALSAEDQAAFQALAQKCVEKKAPDTTPPATEPAAPPATEPAAEPTTKSVETTPATVEENPAVTKALAELAEAKKAYEDMVAKQAENEMLEVAKKYSILGKKPEDLVGTLQALKKSGDAAYNAYIEALDAQVDMVNKSGIFGEVGKSTHADVGTYDEAYAKTETLAKSIMTEKGCTKEQAMIEVWRQNPDLADACASN